MSSAELSEWREYFTLEPFGDAWRQTAYVCTMIGNGNGGRKGGRKFQPADFMPTRPRKQPAMRQTPEQMLAVFKAMAARK